MSRAPRVHVHGVGLSCPVGRRAGPAWAAMNAGIRVFDELPYVDDAKRAIVGSRAEFIHERSRVARMLGLLRDVLDEVLLVDPLAVGPLPLILALPIGIVDAHVSAAQLREAVTRLGHGRLDPSRIALVLGNATAGIEAIALARDMLEQGRAAVVVAGVDSLVCAEPLLELLEQRRLLTDDQPDGVVPGEAAACVLLAAAPTSMGPGFQPAAHASRSALLQAFIQHRGRRAVIEGIGFGTELATASSEVPLRALGAREAARLALAEAGCELHDVDVRVSDAAGEGYAFKEQALVVSGLLRRNKPAFPLRLPAATLGDTGTAAGLVGLVAATLGFALGPASESRALVLAGAPVDPKRAALVCSRA